MNRLRRIMRQLRRKLPTTDFVEHKHGECANFENGRCKVLHITVNPNGNACPHFKDKKKKQEPKTTGNIETDK